MGDRPRLPVSPANQFISLSGQMLSDPQDFSPALYAFQFFVRYRFVGGLGIFRFVGHKPMP